MSFLKNLFNSTPKNSGDSVETAKKRQQAAIEVLDVFQKHLPTTFESHPASVLYAAAWLAGTSLYRSLGYTHESAPGTVILSDKVNNEWPKLMNSYMFFLQKDGIKLNPADLVLNIPQEYKPKKDILKIQELFQVSYNEIMRKNGFDYVEGAQVGTIICAILTKYYCISHKDLEPKLAAGIVSMGLVEGAKTSPAPLKSESSNTTSASTPVNNAQNSQFMEVLKNIAKNSIDGSGTRLILGEGMASMQDAMTKGGKYILVHPGVVDKLKQNKIDPYLVYEAALRIEVESKIPQIDFVGENADNLLREWSTKPQIQAPFHVRQILWLNANATSLGYEKRENSWVLK